jgi:hypothetical protein
LKKRTKKLLQIMLGALIKPGLLYPKVFCFFFFKKEGLTSQGRQAARQSCLAAGLYQ